MLQDKMELCHNFQNNRCHRMRCRFRHANANQHGTTPNPTSCEPKHQAAPGGTRQQLAAIPPSSRPTVQDYAEPRKESSYEPNCARRKQAATSRRPPHQ